MPEMAAKGTPGSEMEDTPGNRDRRKEGNMAEEDRAGGKPAEPAGNRSREGASLVIVICASALLMAFALAMVYTGGLLMARANRRLEQERCYQLARSFADVLDAELTAYMDPKSAPDDSFYKYVCNFLKGSYGEYDPEHPEETIFHYTAGSADGMDPEKYGSIRVVLYKEASQEEETITSGEIKGTREEVDKLKEMQFQRYIFTVEIIATLGDESYNYQVEYRQKAGYEVEYRYEGGSVVPNEDVTEWHKGNIAGDKVDIDANKMIQYKFLTDSENITVSKFEKVYQ